MSRILIVEEMKGVRKLIAARLKEAGYDIVECETTNSGVEALKTQKFDLVITAILMTGHDGTEILQYIETLAHKPKVIAVSGGNDQIPAEMALLLAKPQANITLKKPLNEDHLLEAVKQLLA